MERKYTFSVKDAVARNPVVRLALPVTMEIGSEEQIAIVGPNGSGKSLFVDLLLGKYPLKEGEVRYDFSPSPASAVFENVKYIAFRDTYGTADAGYYYQQRWNAHDQENAPEVAELLEDGVADEVWKRRLFDMFGIEPMLHKKIILLSSGELRKFQLVKALLSSPRVLVMDNPFIGLDAHARGLLLSVLEQLPGLSVQVILILSMLDDIPGFVTHVIPVADRQVCSKLEREAYLERLALPDEKDSFESLKHHLLSLPHNDTDDASEEIIRLNKVSIRYGERAILKDLDWIVRRGEKWALSGENGAGKSTLLSLVCADNPQSYACDISLFGRRRGTGESIWEIKKHIGYVSPEMHRAYRKNLPAVEIVASGLHDSIGLYKRPHPGQLSVCEWWMDVFGIASLKDRPFLQLSSGEQRLVLLARAFVKDPELLILDEPFHGLDTYNRQRVKAVIETFCRRPHKTLVMVTHYENEFPDVIDHRLYLKKN